MNLPRGSYKPARKVESSCPEGRMNLPRGSYKPARKVESSCPEGRMNLPGGSYVGRKRLETGEWLGRKARRIRDMGDSCPEGRMRAEDVKKQVRESVGFHRENGFAGEMDVAIWMAE